jgi:hypothetical protein
MQADISTSVGTVRGLPERLVLPVLSTPPSPTISDDDSLASAPDSPASSSSFPSLSSSVFLSSAAGGSPAHTHHAHPDPGLIIPSLALPPALRPPTAAGQALGALRLLVVGGAGVLADVLLDRNDDVVHADAWAPVRGGRARRASTAWIEHRDAHGLEHVEPARNVELIELAADDVRLPYVMRA